MKIQELPRWAILEALFADVPGRLSVAWLVSFCMGKDMVLEISSFECSEPADMASVTPLSIMHVLDMGGQSTTGGVLKPTLEACIAYPTMDHIGVFVQMVFMIGFIGTFLTLMFKALVNSLEVVVQSIESSVPFGTLWTTIHKPRMTRAQVNVHLCLGREILVTNWARTWACASDCLAQ